MSIWIILAIAVALIVSILGCRHLNAYRKAHAECIEDEQAVQAYDRAIDRRPEFKFLRRVIVGRLKNHCPKGVLVDIGCGPGHLVASITEALPHLRVIGVDIAEDMLQRATDKLSSLGFNEHVEFRQGDAAKLPLQDGTVDFVVTTLSLHHWQNAQEVMDEVYRVLGVGGQFLLFDFRRDMYHVFYWFIRLAQRLTVPVALRRTNEPTASVFSSYTPVEVEALLSGTSFQECEIKPGIGWLFVSGYKR
ncbi:MAG: class I SAM-dependent methyltransferase [Promethearchaeati archaeon]